ncbi:terpene synthase family protein [Chitinophaga nivalis]|uniref:Terpene synthase n=1 Tax=Chitinophaga nivalis TaxID=2991709 RepID=A0ABT3IHZ1_9BACT|nr:terpene synthase family protein [Chitinophaga nivalis]MCW3466735.1 terpene synthase family protein [Chitinophaga nivalis]MCW3483574.1 terpene synthase family protein [Chitinophaga nivalis]
MSKTMCSPVEFPGPPRISSFSEDVQLQSLHWAERFDFTSAIKPMSWYVKSQFGLQAAREYPYASFSQLCLAGDLLTWLFSVDDMCDRASSNNMEAERMRALLNGFLDILENEGTPEEHILNNGLMDIRDRFKRISPPNLYRQFCKHMTTYLRECFFEIDMQLDDYMPTIAEYFKVRPETGFSIMFPLVAIFSGLNLPDEIYEHDIIQRIELVLNLIGGLGNDLHSLRREKSLEKAGLNLVCIAQKELNITQEKAIQFVIDQHQDHMQQLEQYRSAIPYWSKDINRQVEEYVSGVCTIVKGYDDWAILDTGRYADL